MSLNVVQAFCQRHCPIMTGKTFQICNYSTTNWTHIHAQRPVKNKIGPTKKWLTSSCRCPILSSDFCSMSRIVCFSFDVSFCAFLRAETTFFSSLTLALRSVAYKNREQSRVRLGKSNGQLKKITRLSELDLCTRGERTELMNTPLTCAPEDSYWSEWISIS